MLRSAFKTAARQLSNSVPLRNAVSRSKVADLSALKFDSNGCSELYAVCKIHNIPYMVTKGDTLVLPYKIRNHKVGDMLKLSEVITIGSRNFTYNDDLGIPESAYKLTATLTEITREPKYQVYKKKQRCRRLKTVDVEPFQTHLVINELKLT